MSEQTSYEVKIQDALQEHPEDGLKLSSGVIIKSKPFSFLRLLDIMKKFSDPPVPKVWIEEKGRVEENPNDPSYLEAKAEIEAQRNLAMLDAALAYGTEIVFIPPNLAKPDDDTWIEEIELLGLEVNRTSKLSRYLFWLKYVAIVTPDDMQTCAEYVFKQFGGSVVAVESAIQQNFPSN